MVDGREVLLLSCLDWSQQSNIGSRVSAFTMVKLVELFQRSANKWRQFICCDGYPEPLNVSH